MLPLASAGHREAEGWLTKVNRAHPSPAPGLDAVAHGTWAAYYNNRGSVDLAVEHNRLARQARLALTAPDDSVRAQFALASGAAFGHFLLGRGYSR